MKKFSIDVTRVNPLMMLNAKYGLRTMGKVIEIEQNEHKKEYLYRRT